MRCARLFTLATALAGSLAPTDPAQTDPSPQTTTAPAAVTKLVDQARAAMRAERYEQAVALLESAVRTGPGDTRCLELLARAYERTGERGQAADTLVRLGDAHAAAERHAMAAEAFERAGRLGRDSPDYHVRLARCYCHLKQYLGDITTQSITGGVPDRIVGDRYLLKKAPDRKGVWYVSPRESAIYHVRRARDGGLDTLAMQMLEAEIWFEAGQPARALRIYQAVESCVSGEGRAAYYFRSAQAALAAEDLDEYLTRLLRAIELDPHTYSGEKLTAYMTLAERYSRRGDLDAFVLYLQKAVALAPKSVDLHYRLGNAYWEADRRTEAARQWQVALELNPDHPDRTRMLELIRDVQSPARPPS
jgi:tetratricopeptide (TPR) repeat protein